ncbi:MAG: hypothetical protein M3340_10670 [Actinomycetota bacterium]|nr:hypothetical protein [Actinomycetota bacterium]
MRRGALIILVAIAVAGATVAEAAVTPGTYKGSVKSAGSITLKIDSKKRLVKFVRTNIKVKCDDGTSATNSKITTTGVAPIKSDGTFVWKADAEDVAESGHNWRLGGTVKSPNASGTLKETVRFNAAGEPDPNGSVSCTTGKLRWSAKRQ